MDLSSQAAGIGALAEGTRRRLYEFVTSRPEPVGREQAAAELGIALHNVSFHLDRLVADGLLEVEYRRLSGKSGPGAGRPSKLYRRADREFAVSLPPRRYDLVGEILAAAVTRAAEGAPLDRALRESAHAEGSHLGETARTGPATSQPGAASPTGQASSPGPPASLSGLATVLGGQGFEPRIQDDVVELSNCPFDALAQKHTALVCGLNRSFVQGVADGLGCHEVTACLEPGPGRCCVKARTTR